jgi:hypothetical protein
MWHASADQHSIRLTWQRPSRRYPLTLLIRVTDEGI